MENYVRFCLKSAFYLNFSNKVHGDFKVLSNIFILLPITWLLIIFFNCIAKLLTFWNFTRKKIFWPIVLLFFFKKKKLPQPALYLFAALWPWSTLCFAAVFSLSFIQLVMQATLRRVYFVCFYAKILSGGYNVRIHTVPHRHVLPIVIRLRRG